MDEKKLKALAAELAKGLKTGACQTLSVILCNCNVLKVIAQAVTELDNKTAHC